MSSENAKLCFQLKNVNWFQSCAERTQRVFWYLESALFKVIASLLVTSSHAVQSSTIGMMFSFSNSNIIVYIR